MNIFQVNVNDQAIFLKKLPRSQLDVLELMLNALQNRWRELGCVTQLVACDRHAWSLIVNIAGLFERVDRPKERWRIDDLLKSEIHTIESLFLFRVQPDQLGFDPPLLASAHAYDPIKRRPRPADEEPIQLSGDYDADLLAQLCNGLDSFTEAIAAINTLDAEMLDRFLYSLDELRRDPEERLQENLAEDFEGWKQENLDIYKESLGLKFNFPTEEDLLAPLPEEE